MFIFEDVSSVSAILEDTKMFRGSKNRIVSCESAEKNEFIACATEEHAAGAGRRHI